MTERPVRAARFTSRVTTTTWRVSGGTTRSRDTMRRQTRTAVDYSGTTTTPATTWASRRTVATVISPTIPCGGVRSTWPGATRPARSAST